MRKARGKYTLTNLLVDEGQSFSNSAAIIDPVFSLNSTNSSCTYFKSLSSFSGNNSTISLLHFLKSRETGHVKRITYLDNISWNSELENHTNLLKLPSTSKTYAIPPDMPAAKLRPVRPKMTVQPPVMYSQPWSPTP